MSPVAGPLYLPIFNEVFLVDVLAGFHILPVKRLAPVEMTEAEIRGKLDEMNDGEEGPVINISTAEPPPFYNSATMYHTNSWSSHMSVHIPRRRALETRRRHPDLMEPRALPGTWLEKLIKPPKLLKALPAEPRPFEVIESSAMVDLNDMREVTREGEFVVSFARDWTDAQADAICYALYYLYSAPYDIFEIGKKILPWWPNLRQIKVCSTFIETGLEGRDPKNFSVGPDNPPKGDSDIRAWLLDHFIKPDEMTPAAGGRYLFQNPLYFRERSFRCSLTEARAKI